MVEEERMFEAADRGGIYDFIESDGTVKNQVLVVSSQKRAKDRMISILMVGDSMLGYDVVRVNYNGQKRYVHCGMITYTARNRLGRKVCTVSSKVMGDIDFTIANELGLSTEKALVYRELYYELLAKVTGEER